jgi:peptide/nickel transport system substrate-binding protein
VIGCEVAPRRARGRPWQRGGPAGGLRHRTGTYAYGGHPDIDNLFAQQAQERDPKKREVMLHQIQRLMHERVMYAPIFEPATLHGVGPRVEEPAVGLNPLLYFAAPYEDMRVKKP